MKRIAAFLLALSFAHANAANLMSVYQDALQHDPTYRQILAQQLSNAQGEYISLAGLLPNAGISFLPFLSKTIASGSAINFTTLPDGSSTTGSSATRGYSAGLNINQPLIDFMKINKFLMDRQTAKQAQALINAAGQDLIVRVAQAYFTVVSDEETLLAAMVIRDAFYHQFRQVKGQYQLGYKSVIDLHTAEASYEKSKLTCMSLEITLTADRERLHVVTQRYYPSFAILKDHAPLFNPNPNNVEQWVETAEKQNWNIKAAKYETVAAINNVRQQWSGHLPSVYLQGGYSVSFNRNMGDSSSPSTGTSRFKTSFVNLSVNFPVFSGGQVLAQTKKAQYDYDVSHEKLDKQFLDTIAQAKESFYGVNLRIYKIEAGRVLISATKKSLAGMEENYRAGRESLINVLNQRENLYDAQKEYINDRYLYLINFLRLKQAAGTLCMQDIMLINSWLIERY